MIDFREIDDSIIDKYRDRFMNLLTEMEEELNSPLAVNIHNIACEEECNPNESGYVFEVAHTIKSNSLIY